MKGSISALVGILLSLALHLIPRVRTWWDSKRGKVLILLSFHVGGAIAIWVLSCFLGFTFSFPVDCSAQGLASSGWTGAVGFIANQTTYGLTNYGIPYVKARIHEHST